MRHQQSTSYASNTNKKRNKYQQFLKSLFVRADGPITIPCFVQTSSRDIFFLSFFDVERIRDTSPTNDAWAYYIADAQPSVWNFPGVFWGWTMAAAALRTSE